MKWIQVDDYEELSRAAATRLLQAVRDTPSIVLGLPTGRTPEGMYSRLVAECSHGSHCFDDVTTFNLDEYVGIDSRHPSSYATYMQQHFFSHIDLRPERANLPDGTAAGIRAEHAGVSDREALELECARYEQAIAAAGSLQLTFLGLGRNGHIGFNEPGTPFDSRTRVVQLTSSTRQANAANFSDGSVPEKAITMGIGTIRDSAAVVLLASGPSKAGAVARLRRGEVTTDFPASALLDHPDVTVIVDRAADTSP